MDTSSEFGISELYTLGRIFFLSVLPHAPVAYHLQDPTRRMGGRHWDNRGRRTRRVQYRLSFAFLLLLLPHGAGPLVFIYIDGRSPCFSVQRSGFSLPSRRIAGGIVAWGNILFYGQLLD